MDLSNKQSVDDSGASLPLPEPAQKPAEDASNPAAELIRKKVEAAYSDEPDVKSESLDIAELGPGLKRTKHQQFMYDLTNSGKSLADIQTAWNEYYAGLPDPQKHEVWQEFYATHAQASSYTPAQSTMEPEVPEEVVPEPLRYEETPVSHSMNLADRGKKTSKAIGRSMADMRDYAMGAVSKKSKLRPMQHVQSLLFGLGVGSIVLLIVMFSFFNERFIAPFIQPSRNVTNTPIINSDLASGNDPEILIPKINVEIPVVYDVNTIDDNAVETALERGVVHYADTATPGQNGNVVVVGHSSNNIFNPGKYKFAFVLLSRLDNGDTFYMQKDGKRYTYEVYDKKIVKPTDVSVLAPNDNPATATLITCDPPGTSTNRLVVVGKQINPDPASNASQTANNSLATKSAVIPGNSPSLWSRVIKWFSS